MSEKYTRFRDIPQLTGAGNWECDFDMEGLWYQIKKWQTADDSGPALDLDPDFQRAHVWTEDQQIAWLEFFMRGGKTGRVIYLNCAGWMKKWEGPFVIVDGKQRVEAIRRFIEGEIAVYGSYFPEFTDRLRIHQTMKININDLPARAAVLQWYVEMNAGGTPHTADEIERVRGLLAEVAR